MIILTFHPLPSTSSKITPNPTTPTTDTTKIVTVYLLIDTIDTLQQYINDLQLVNKVNFNRVIFSFIKPTLTNYQSGSLANTGILGYYNNGDGNGIESFNLLKIAINLSKLKNIQTFLSIGGWNYSCNYEIYQTKCGDPPSEVNGIYYDYFPDPTISSEYDIAIISYNNVIQLANDLEVDGLDIDAEEFWHGDYYAIQWKGNPWTTSIANNILENGGPTYDNLMTYGTGSSTSTGPAVMPKTIEKLSKILNLLKNNLNSSNLLFSSATPPVGARPITGFVYGDNYPDIYTYGGLWWLGNLKGLWYHLNEYDSSIISRFDSLGLMTYDLCGNGVNCEPYGGGPTDLPGQVEAYMEDYRNWLKSSTPSSSNMTIDSNGKVIYFPAKYSISSKIQFGFEVSQPAYPKDIAGQLQLTDELVDTILLQQSNRSDGVIIWQMYSIPNTMANGTTIQYTIQQSCKTFLLNDDRYDCNASFPASMTNIKGKV